MAFYSSYKFASVVVVVCEIRREGVSERERERWGERESERERER